MVLGMIIIIIIPGLYFFVFCFFYCPFKITIRNGPTLFQVEKMIEFFLLFWLVFSPIGWFVVG